STYECKVDPATDWKPCASPYSVKLPDGTYTFYVRATDEAGNVEPNPPSRTFTVDTGSIDTFIDAGPHGPTHHPTPSFPFGSPSSGATFQCRIDGAGSSLPAFADCSAPFTAPKLPSGAYVLKVRAKSVDGKLDSTPAERAFTVDADAPDTQFVDGPRD